MMRHVYIKKSINEGGALLAHKRILIIFVQSMEMLGLFYDPDESMYLRNAK